MFHAALARAHVYAAHHSNYGGSSQHGGAFPYRGLRRRAARRARPRGARLAHGLLRRRGACLSAFPAFPVARPPNRVRARTSHARRHAERPPRTRVGRCARSKTVYSVASRAPRWRARTRAAPHAACIARARLRSGLGSGFTARATRRIKCGPHAPRRERARETLPAAPLFLDAALRSAVRVSRLDRSPLALPSPLAAPRPAEEEVGKAGAQPERQPRSPPHAREDQRQGGGDHRR